MDLGKFWKDAKEVATNILTAGGYSAIQTSVAKCEDKLREHRISIDQFNNANADFKNAVDLLGKEASDCMALLKDAKDLVLRLSYSTLSSNLPSLPQFEAPDLATVSTTLADFDAAITAGQGVGLGAAASTGAWVLVAHLGTASTGAAISGLGGIAAHNAILAWFGGGALAAGGGGMLLGGFVIGAIAAVPLVGYSAYKSYKEASRIDSEAAKANEAAKSNVENAAKLRDLKKSADWLCKEIADRRRQFTEELSSLKHQANSLAKRTADSANAFAASLAYIAKSKGASA